MSATQRRYPHGVAGCNQLQASRPGNSKAEWAAGHCLRRSQLEGFPKVWVWVSEPRCWPANPSHRLARAALPWMRPVRSGGSCRSGVAVVCGSEGLARQKRRILAVHRRLMAIRACLQAASAERARCRSGFGLDCSQPSWVQRHPLRAQGERVAFMRCQAGASTRLWCR